VEPVKRKRRRDDTIGLGVERSSVESRPTFRAGLGEKGIGEPQWWKKRSHGSSPKVSFENHNLIGFHRCGKKKGSCSLGRLLIRVGKAGPQNSRRRTKENTLQGHFTNFRSPQVMGKRPSLHMDGPC